MCVDPADSLLFRERIEGVLLGLRAGDRNGGPVRMALKLAESLADCGSFQIDDVWDRYLHWWKEGAFDTGPITAAVLSLGASGIAPSAAAAQVHRETDGNTAGCNPAHRCAPLAMSSSLSDEQLPSAACGEAALTHKHPLAGDVAAAVVVLCRKLLRGEEWSSALLAAAYDRRKETREALGSQPSGSFRAGGFSPDALGAAIHFLGSNADFKSALSAALRFAGPLNYCPVLVGAIGGARWGKGDIPSSLLPNNEILSRIQRVSEQLAGCWSCNRTRV